MKKLRNSILALWACTVLFCACSAKQPVPPAAQAEGTTENAEDPFEGMDIAPFVEEAKRALDLTNARDYAAVAALFRDKGADADAMRAQMDPVFDDTGPFVQYGEFEAVSGQDTSGEYLLAVYILCEHENKTISWQVAFDEDMQLVAMLTMGIQ